VKPRLLQLVLQTLQRLLLQPEYLLPPLRMQPQ